MITATDHVESSTDLTNLHSEGSGLTIDSAQQFLYPTKLRSWLFWNLKGSRMLFTAMGRLPLQYRQYRAQGYPSNQGLDQLPFQSVPRVVPNRQDGLIERHQISYL